uniref:Pyruvate kinase n=1 Tax=Quercus lobata TaxID=97700 RepID=A0A7N2KJS3_QUELO
MLCSIYYHPCPKLSVCPPSPSPSPTVYITKKKQIPLFPISSSWVSNNESGATASTSKNSSSSSREIEVTTGSSARGRRLLKIREEKRKRQLDNLHNYPAWAKVLEDACKHDHELRAILAYSIGNPDLMRKRVEERVRKKGRDFHKSKTGSILAFKVENQEGVINFDEILRETDSFMVARGDLGMEIPVEKIFLAQKMMIYKCNLVGKPVVTATQMLESMIKSPRPTRAEATDVANAVLDGTDCVMLSGESAAGAYPEIAVKIMARICIEAESSLDYGAIFKEMIRSTPLPMSPLESLASSAVRTANKAKAKLIVVLTRGGTTAKLVAKYRPAVPILSVVVPVLTTDSFDWTCSDETPARHSLIYRGLIPLLAEGSAKATDAESTEVILEAALKSATQKGLCKPGDAVVALHRIGAASVIKICVVK